MPASSLPGSEGNYHGYPIGQIPPYPFKRLRQREIMDEDGLDPALRDEAMRGIEQIATWWGQRQPLFEAIYARLHAAPKRQFRLIELGAGNGHLGRWMERELRQRGLDLELLATDLHATKGVASLDCCSEKLPEADIYFSNLLLHHLDDWSVCKTLKLQSERAKLGFFHFDLQRHYFHYWIARLRIGNSGLSPVNQSDALLSIIQGYSREELLGLVKAAGLHCELRWSFPFRWLLSWKP